MPGEPVEGAAARSKKGLWLTVGAVVVVVFILAGVLAARQGSGAGLPEELLGLPRIHSAQMQAFENMMGSIHIGDLRITAGAYGNADQPAILVASYSGLPSDAATSMDGLMAGAVNGGSASGGSFDDSSELTQTRAGVEYRCVSFFGAVFPGSPAQGGVMCVWPEGQRQAMLLLDMQTQDPKLGLEHAVAVHDATS